MLLWPLAATGISTGVQLETHHDQSTRDILVAETTNLVTRTEQEESFLMRRVDCAVWGDIVSTFGTSTGLIIYSTTSYYTSYLICIELGLANCDTRATVMGLAFASIFYHFSDSPTAAVPGRRALAAPITQTEGLIGTYAQEGFTYESVTDISHTIQGRSTGGKQALHTTAVRGLKYPWSNETVSFNMIDFGEGNGHIEMPGELFHPASTTLGKRVNAPGFKISYTSRLQSKLTQAHISTMSSLLGFWWADNTDHDHTIANVMGLVKTESTANFYWRIIPENSNFGLDYESVDICGGMAGWLDVVN